MPRINLQYSVEVDELAPEMKRLYEKASSVVNNLSLIQYSESQVLTSGLVNHIHETRLKLAQADAMLRDIQLLVSSYVEYEISQRAEAEPTADGSETPHGNPTTLDDINSSIQQIKQSVENEKPPQRS